MLAKIRVLNHHAVIHPLTTLTITQPDDWHHHLRDDEFLKTTVSHAAQQFGRVIVMPNLKQPVVDVASARAYRERILQAMPKECSFTPLMTLYLTDNTTPAILEAAKASGFIYAVKYYPAGATTHSSNGVTDLKKVYVALETLEKLGMPLLMHGEVTDNPVDIFDREAIFIERQLMPLLQHFPALPMVLEHITTKEAVDVVMESPDNLAATLTPQHLLYNRNDLLVGGIKPHYYCLPILKAETHRQRLVSAAISGHPRFFLGTDSAPHPRPQKESACGCAGIYSAHAALAFYADIFEQHNALDKLENFASHFGADFYGLPRNTQKVTLSQIPQTIPQSFTFGEHELTPLGAGKTLNWTLSHE